MRIGETIPAPTLVKYKVLLGNAMPTYTRKDAVCRSLLRPHDRDFRDSNLKGMMVRVGLATTRPILCSRRHATVQDSTLFIQEIQVGVGWTPMVRFFAPCHYSDQVWLDVDGGF